MMWIVFVQVDDVLALHLSQNFFWMKNENFAFVKVFFFRTCNSMKLRDHNNHYSHVYTYVLTLSGLLYVLKTKYYRTHKHTRMLR